MSGPAPSFWPVIALGAGLALAGNAKTVIAGDRPAGGLGGAAFGAATTGLALLWAARVERLEAADVGLDGTQSGSDHLRAAAIGAAAALTCAGAVATMALGGAERLGLRRHAPAIPAALLEMREAEVLSRVLVFLPLDTVVPEEVAFRGVLHGALRRRVRTPAAVALSAVPFALWHTTLALTETPTQGATQLALKFAGYYLGGVGFGLLRGATGSLAAPLAAHWTLNATLMLLLHPLARRVTGRGRERAPARGRARPLPPRSAR